MPSDLISRSALLKGLKEEINKYMPPPEDRTEYGDGAASGVERAIRLVESAKGVEATPDLPNEWGVESNAD